MANELQRIEKELVLRELIQYNTAISLQLSRQQLQFKLSKFDNETLTLVTDEPKNAHVQEAQFYDLYFQFRETPMTCTVKFIREEFNNFIFSFPDSIFKDLQRKYERVNVGNAISISLITEGNQIELNFPASASYFNPDSIKVIDSIKSLDIKQLIARFQKDASSFSRQSDLVLFSDRQPTTIAERFLAYSGRIVNIPLENIPDCQNMRTQIYRSTDIDWIAEDSGETVTSINLEVQKYQVEMKNRGIEQEILFPILYFEYVIGYLHISLAEHQKISCNQLKAVHQYSTHFSYVLKNSGFFEESQGRKKIANLELIDISATGMFFVYPESAPVLDTYRMLRIILHLNKHAIPLKGRVIRKFRNNNQLNIAVQFLDTPEKILSILMKILYGNTNKNYTVDPTIL